jgi:hypothetical protein
LGGDFVFPHVFVGKLDGNLEFYWNQIVATDLTRASSRDEVFDTSQPLFAAKRLPRRGEDGRRIAPGRLRSRRHRMREHPPAQSTYQQDLCENAHK